MVVAEVSVLPVGTKSPSLSKYVAGALKILKKKNLKFQITPMSTIIEGNLDEILEIVKEMHEEVFKSGALRVLTTLKIDDRRDREISMESKVKSVENKI